MKKMSTFQLIFLGICILLIFLGVGAFAFLQGGTQSKEIPVTVWGTANGDIANAFITSVLQKAGSKNKIFYVQQTAENFDQAFLEALATGNPPDAVLLPQDSLIKHQNKLLKLPYDVLSERDFKSSYIQEAELYLTPEGIIAVPFSVDPIVMYWNRDIFTNANIALPPKTWDEFLTLAPTLTKRDAALNISQSAVALGEFRNITHAKDILSLLIMQAGNPITVQTETGLQSSISAMFNYTIAPTDAAITFFTQFSDPVKQVYSWNRALPASKQLFLANKLGVYFGYASELEELRQKNPNLNFDVALVPQPAPSATGQANRLTYGRMYGFALVRNAPNPSNALTMINMLLTKDAQTEWTKISGLPSVRRDSLAVDPSRAESPVFTTSALIARGWLDPDGPATLKIFQEMVEAITSGRLFHSEAISQAESQVQGLINKYNAR